MEALARRAELPGRALRSLADADACRSIGVDRREALWEARRMPDDVLPLFAAAQARELAQGADARLPAMPLAEHVATDYQTTRPQTGRVHVWTPVTNAQHLFPLCLEKKYIKN